MKTKITLLLLMNFFFVIHLSAQCSGADFEEKNGIAILEMETRTAGSWRKESVSGATAGSAIVYRGANSFSGPSSSVITYNVKINSPCLKK